MCKSRRLRQAYPWIAALALAGLAGCGRRDATPRREPAVLLPLQVLADTGRATSLAVPPPEVARAWLASVARRPPASKIAAASPARSAPLDLPPPEARPEAPPISREPTDVLVADDDLHAPIPIGVAPLHLPPLRGRTLGIDLDVRIDESGAVSDALWAAGSEDSSAVEAVITCALAMRFHPALQHGRPVAVWCRQHFAFGRGGARLTPEAASSPEGPEGR